MVNENCEITKTFFSHQCICWNQDQGDFFLKKTETTPCKAEQPLQGMESKEKEAQKDFNSLTPGAGLFKYVWPFSGHQALKG